MAKNIRAVIFDYGNVLCPMPPLTAFDAMAGIAGIPPRPFIESLWRHRLDYDRGTLDGRSYWQLLAKENEKQFPDLLISRLMEADFALWVHPSPVMLAWAHKLHLGGMKTSILSNMPSDFSTYLRAHAEWLNDFDVKVFSGELGVVKPDVKIYQVCLEGLGVQAREALFIDDVAINVEAARDLGINSIKFESIAQLARELVQFNSVAPLSEMAGLTLPGN